jgi:hypothetical protein
MPSFGAGFALAVFFCAATVQADPPTWDKCETATIEHGQLKVVFRDNRQSPGVLSGADSLFHRNAPEFDAFDPDSKGASAGLNFEHIIAGHASPHNMFTPRRDRYELFRALGQPAARLVRDGHDEPWRVSSTLTYTLREPHSIDVDFRCQAHEPERFGQGRYAVLFFANYMNDVEQVALNFLGKQSPNDASDWIAADAPPGHVDYNGGGTYRHAAAQALEYDTDHNFKLNLWSYDWPRFTEPFYYVCAARGMTLIMMFDRTHSAEDEIRFSLFKFKVPKFPRPACDWQYVIHDVQPNRTYGFRARLAWKKFVSADDCQQEYERWNALLADARPD